MSQVRLSYVQIPVLPNFPDWLLQATHRVTVLYCTYILPTFTINVSMLQSCAVRLQHCTGDPKFATVLLEYGTTVQSTQKQCPPSDQSDLRIKVAVV